MGEVALTVRPAMVMAPVFRSKTATTAAKRWWRPKAGLADRNTGTGRLVSLPTWAALTGAKVLTHEKQRPL